jgi:hypothetical protein
MRVISTMMHLIQLADRRLLGATALAVLLALGFATTASAQAPVPGPAGLFVIGDTRYVPTEVAKFDLDFVSGYTLRVPWADLETWDDATQTPRYNFSRIDATLEDLRARGKRMTLEIFIAKVPDYVLALPGTVTWNNPHPTQGGVQVVPWDTNALAAYAAMIRQLADHVVAGTSWTVAEHPTLESVDASIVGLQGLRDLSGVLVRHPAYVRATFIQSIVDAVGCNRRAFPGKYGFLALFLMDDLVPEPALDAEVHARLLAEFNQPGQPSLGFFQETLSDTGPRPDTLGSLLAASVGKTYLLFQALRPWTLRPTETTTPPEVASGTPVTGLNFAWTHYRSTYAEIYGAGALNTANTTALRAWNRFLLAAKSAASGTETPTLAVETPGQLRLRWNADTLVSYRLWQSTDLLSWTVAAPTDPLDGDLILPAPAAAQKIFFRLEPLPPAP